MLPTAAAAGFHVVVTMVLDSIDDDDHDYNNNSNDEKVFLPCFQRFSFFSFLFCLHGFYALINLSSF